MTSPSEADLLAHYRRIALRTRCEMEESNVKGVCPDRHVGLIQEVMTWTDWEPAPKTSDPALRRASPCIILVLESPHTYEYARPVPCPANGPTGRQIRRHVCDLARALGNQPQDVGLVLLNAVPFQCSLGVATKKYRDVVFREMWSSGGREFFQKRLATWWRKGDAIVNACTIGNDPRKPLRADVEQAIEELRLGAPRARRMHPFSWHTSEQASAEWE